MFKRAKKELAKQTIATEEFAASDAEDQYLGASSDSEVDDDLDHIGGGDSEGSSEVDDDSGNEDDDIEGSIDLKEFIRQKAEESGHDELDLDDEEALKKLIEEEGLADLDELEELEDGSEAEDENEDEDDEEQHGEDDDEEGEGVEEEEEEEEGDMIYSCKICPHRILKNEKAVEVHLQGKVCHTELLASIIYC
jgi:hypothetical protein